MSTSAMADALILAGGLGTRLRSAVPDLPKPMATVNGRPFLEYLMGHWRGQGVSHFLLSVGYRMDAIVDFFSDSYCGCDISYVVEPQPLGTGGALLLALSENDLSAPFLLINGDTFFPLDYKALLQSHRSRSADITVALTRVDSNSRYSGVQLEDDGLISSFSSRRGESGRQLINAGVYLIEPDALARYGSASAAAVSFEDEIIPELIAEGARVVGHIAEVPFIDIGIPEDYRRCGELLGNLAACD
jgi:D-glycero-alpha-D-manno-heptose 1-phosphate guanylyltransferase